MEFIEATDSTSTTPEIVAQADVPIDSMDKEQLCCEVLKLRKQLEELNEGREGDRKSILILQQQIDCIRNSSKCTDSVESSLALMGNIAAYLWNKLPALPSIPRARRKTRSVNDPSRASSKSSKKASSVRSTPSPPFEGFYPIKTYNRT
jgi:hypothetical protein